jgi:hypothetical protein
MNYEMKARCFYECDAKIRTSCTERLSRDLLCDLKTGPEFSSGKETSFALGLFHL